MKVRGPLATLGAVAVLGGAIWLVNVSKEGEPAAPAKPVAASAPAAVPSQTVQAPAPVAPAPPPAPAFPATADYVGKVPTRSGVITLDISVDGGKAVAYACDGNTVEAWLTGPAENGTVKLANKDRTSRLEGRLQGDAVVGTLWIGQGKWEFTAAGVREPAGLYVYEDAGVRNSWIVDADGTVTGVQRLADGTTAPAPSLSSDGIAVVDGQRISATRVDGDDNV